MRPAFVPLAPQSRTGIVLLIAALAITLSTSTSFAAEAAAPEPLSAEQRTEGLWYLDQLGIPAARAEGLTGEGVHIAVVDIGINLQAAELQGANISVKGGYCLNQDTGVPFPADSTDPEIAGHGTNVVASIVGSGRAQDGSVGATGIAPKTKISFFAGGPLVSEEQQSQGWLKGCPTKRGEDGSFEGNAWEIAFLDAINSGASIISVSVVGSVVSFKQGLALAAARGITVVGGIPNPSASNVGLGTFPGAGNGTVSVNALGVDGNLIGTTSDSTQFGSPNMAITAPGVKLLGTGSNWMPTYEFGTSFATPLVAGSLGLLAQKYPKATGNQLIQNLIIHARNPSPAAGNSTWDQYYGYGVINLPGMLEVDPTGLPDNNPLFVQDPRDPRCTLPGDEPAETMAQCSWAQAPSVKDVQAAREGLGLRESTEPGADTSSTSPVATAQQNVILPLGITGVLLVAAAAALIILRIRRQSPKRRAQK